MHQLKTPAGYAALCVAMLALVGAYDSVAYSGQAIWALGQVFASMILGTALPDREMIAAGPLVILTIGACVLFAALGPMAILAGMFRSSAPELFAALGLYGLLAAGAWYVAPRDTLEHAILASASIGLAASMAIIGTRLAGSRMRLLAPTLIVIACVADPSYAGLMEVHDHYVTVVSSDEYAITVTDGDSTFSVRASVLNMPVERGQELKLVVVMTCLGCDKRPGTILNGWKSSGSTRADTISGAVEWKGDWTRSSGETVTMVTIRTSDGFENAVLSPQEAESLSANDTVTVVRHYTWWERRYRDGTLEVETDLRTEKFAVADHRPFKR